MRERERRALKLKLLIFGTCETTYKFIKLDLGQAICGVVFLVVSRLGQITPNSVIVE